MCTIYVEHWIETDLGSGGGSLIIGYSDCNNSSANRKLQNIHKCVDWYKKYFLFHVCLYSSLTCTFSRVLVKFLLLPTGQP